MDTDQLIVAMAQIAPVWLDREATLAKVVDYIKQAGTKNADLVVFGKALVPGYPFWLELTNGARFNDPKQKAMHAHYIVSYSAVSSRPICNCS